MSESSALLRHNNTTEEENHYIFLPGLHGTAELFDDLFSHITRLKNLTNSTLISYPADIEQSYNQLFKWLCSHIPINPPPTQKLIIIAESFSSPIALKLAESFPSRIKAIIIAGGFCSSPANPALTLLPLRPIFTITPPDFIIRYFLTGPESSDILVKKVRSIIKKASSKNISQRIRNTLSLQKKSPHGHSRIKPPTLLLQARNDAIISPQAQNQLEQYIPHAQIHWLDSPHLILQTHPKTCASHMIEFLGNL